ncbi:MAG: ABC transporter permease [Candidatus Caenarcaniphilales bacterium]|nr:ABC transporter permease [Candidatus Caenarcaniphilales bacterium]
MTDFFQSNALLRFLREEVRPVVRKEIIHILNDPTTLRIAILIPIMQLIIFGFSINTEVRNVPTYIFDQSQTRASYRFVQKLEATTYFKVKEYVHSREALLKGIISGRAGVGIVIPTDYGRNLSAKKSTQIQALIDGSDSNIATQTQSALLLLGVTIANDYLVKERQGSFSAGAERLEIRPRFLFNPNLETSFLILPGMVGIVVFLVIIFLTTLSLVREKESGTLEQLLVTPLSTSGLLIGKILPYMGVGFLDFNLSLFFAYVVFGVPIRGNLFWLELAIFLFMFSALGIALIIGSIAENQAQAAQMVQISFLPSIFLSGYIFPFDSMPVFFQGLGYLLPVTYFIRISRGIILRGAEIVDLTPYYVAMVIFGGLIFYISIKIFRKELG